MKIDTLHFLEQMAKSLYLRTALKGSVESKGLRIKELWPGKKNIRFTRLDQNSI